MSNTLGQAGFTGLGITPNAHLLHWGRAELGYDNQLPGLRNTTGHNWVLGFGLLPNVEIAGRLAANTLHTNCLAANCGARDLSASGKASIGLDAQGHWRLGAGATDVGGAVTYFRTLYGVLTYDQGPWQASAGLARRSGAGINGSRSPLDGPFASLAWQPLPWLRAHVEMADAQAWAGVRVFAPAAWLPRGWQLSAGAHQRLTDTALTERQWWSANLSVPLYHVPAPAPRRPSAEPARLAAPASPAAVASDPGAPARQAHKSSQVAGLPPSDGATTPLPKPGSRASSPEAPAPEDLLQLAARLQDAGLEDIWVGRMADHSIAVRAENASYRWNSVDALGAGLGVIAHTLGDQPTAFRFILTQRQQPLVAVTGQADCLRQWIDDAASCAGGELTTPGMQPLDALHGGADWLVQRGAPSSETLRVIVEPVLRTNIGSEVGALDASLGASIGLQLPLWAGASAEVRQAVPVYETRNYEDGGVFASRRVRTQLERVAFTQTIRLPVDRWLAPGDPLAARRWGLGAVTGQVTLGRIGGWWDGALASVRWEPAEGLHRVTAMAGHFRHADPGEPNKPGPQSATPILGSYRYYVSPTRTALEATAGRFFYNDLGLQLGLRQWFDDVSVAVYYKRTRFENQPVRQFGGVEISLPLTPRRERAAAGPVGFMGAERFATGLETTLREGRGNPVRFGHGLLPPAPTLDATFNSDRAGLRYFEDNIRRIRDAARHAVP
ncbi:YjbH domain-containing protein [Ramlibacter rhizophilus]|uniref:YjbH domain-containing protein n=1 Tax=Ramlibacter rhizophilus TaxID=1781167 RepID=UPI00143241F3|nr:YjbH domain-containing protein [Ramlibacter rhizophilus]